MFYSEDEQFEVLNSYKPVADIIVFFLEDVDVISVNVAEVILFRSCLNSMWGVVAEKIFNTNSFCSMETVMLVADLCLFDEVMWDTLLSSKASQDFIDAVKAERLLRSGVLVAR